MDIKELLAQFREIKAGINLEDDGAFNLKKAADKFGLSQKRDLMKRAKILLYSYRCQAEKIEKLEGEQKIIKGELELLGQKVLAETRNSSAIGAKRFQILWKDLAAELGLADSGGSVEGGELVDLDLDELSLGAGQEGAEVEKNKAGQKSGLYDASLLAQESDDLLAYL